MKNKQTKTIRSDLSAEDRFRAARNYLKNIGVILSIYSSVIRAITSAPTILKTKDQSKIDAFAVGSAISPIRISPTLSESFYLAAAELYPKEFENIKQSGTFGLRKTLKLLNASEISAVLGITYFFKLLNKCCDWEEFSRIAPVISVNMRLGAIVGAQSGVNFGRGGGIAATGLRTLAVAVLIKANIKAFKKYRRLIEESGVLSHTVFELENFGCTHLDIASTLAGELGFGPVAREAFIVYQTGLAKASTPEGVFWNHTLNETTKLWSARQALKLKTSISKVGQNTLEGLTWLWGQNGSSDLLPGVELEEILDLVPDKSTHPTSLPVPEPDKEPTTNLSVLIVEDDKVSSQMLDKILAPLGNIKIAGSAESAKALIAEPKESLPFNLILLDVGLPGISGLEFLNNIRSIEQALSTPDASRCKVFMITSDDTPQTVMQAFSKGADGYLTKPLNREDIALELAKNEIILG